MIELGLLSWGLCVAAGAAAEPHMGLRSLVLGGADEGFGVPKGVHGTWWPWGEVVSGLGRGLFTWVCWHRGWVGAGGMLESPCCRLSLWQGRCQDGAGEGWHAVGRHGGIKTSQHPHKVFFLLYFSSQCFCRRANLITSSWSSWVSL